MIGICCVIWLMCLCWKTGCPFPNSIRIMMPEDKTQYRFTDVLNALMALRGKPLAACHRGYVCFTKQTATRRCYSVPAILPAASNNRFCQRDSVTCYPYHNAVIGISYYWGSWNRTTWILDRTGCEQSSRQAVARCVVAGLWFDSEGYVMDNHLLKV